MRKQIFDEELVLNCDCNEPRCLVYFLFENDKKWGSTLFFDFEYCDIKLWSRIKKAFHFVFFGKQKENVDIILHGPKPLEELRDFCDRCLALIRLYAGEKNE